MSKENRLPMKARIYGLILMNSNRYFPGVADVGKKVYLFLEKKFALPPSKTGIILATSKLISVISEFHNLPLYTPTMLTLYPSVNVLFRSKFGNPLVDLSEVATIKLGSTVPSKKRMWMIFFFGEDENHKEWLIETWYYDCRQKRKADLDRLKENCPDLVIS
jgi:hypothetical protein